ncbi:hypothetical protein PVIIG_03166 [Plasmodium vivax India VII]|uniref:Phosphatidylinositol-4-phosphate 5-kinase n=1 Tax=Plasmodium vivax India VII TaxID=1077284 RepID=A0A0J9SE58_PLAVI|nr:hypothetical protein PVIIG_03166 [Plasmodium vivax India VII]
MGNECSCGEVSSAKERMPNGEANKKLQDVHLCWDEAVGKNPLSEEEGADEKEDKDIDEDEETDDNYFYRLEKKKNMNRSGEKGKHKEGAHTDKRDIFGDHLERDCTINVKKILMYVREYEDDFFLFFKKRNATNLIFLKYIILNYEKYMLRVADTGVVYIGEVSPKNEKHGLGVIITPDQCMYIGEFEEDEITGFGLYVHFSKSIYIGHWKGGKTNHYGMFTHTDGTFYKGLWSNDKQNEKGIEHVQANYVFLGNYRRGEKNGFGAFILKNESMYIGHVKNNCFSKKGIYFFNRKKMYISNWERNCIGGACEIVWLDRRQFYGYHSTNNSKEGIGIYKWNDGRIYFGNWSNNKQHGYGVFIVIKHIREYERREGAPLFFFFEQTRKVKEYFFLNLLKESFFEKGRVRAELKRAIWGGAADQYEACGAPFSAASQEEPPREGPPNGRTPQCNHLDAYLFLMTLLRMRYYQTCRSYFDHLQRKKCNSFKFNCTFYERVREHICSVTNSFLTRRGVQERWGGSNSRGEGSTGEESDHSGESNESNESDESGETSGGTGEETDDSDESEETNGRNGDETHRGDHPSGEKNPPQQRHQTEDNHPPFEDIERLKNYLSCLNLRHVTEGDITPRSPLFTFASCNLVLKLGRWKNGKLQEWIHSSDRSRVGGGRVKEQAGSSNGKKGRKQKEGRTQELLPRPCNRCVIDKILDRMSSSEGESQRSGQTNGQTNHQLQDHQLQDHQLHNHQPLNHQPLNHQPLNHQPLNRQPHGEQEETRSDSGSGYTSGGSSFEATSPTSHLRDGHQATSFTLRGELNVKSSFAEESSVRKGVDPGGVPPASILHKGEDNEGDVDSTHEINVRQALRGERGSRLGQESDSMGGKKPGQRGRNDAREGSENDARGGSKNGSLRVGENDARRTNKSRPRFASLPEKDEEGILSSVTSHNYDLPKKGFSLIWSLKRMKNSHLSANEHIAFEAPQAYDDEEDGQSGARHKKKKSFFGKFLRGGRRIGGEAKREE